MKHLLISVSMLAAATSVVAADGGYTITGNIPGLKAGSKVELRNHDDRRGPAPSATVTDGHFVLEGTVDMPSECEVIISEPGSDLGGYAFPIMVENVPYTVTAAHIDSVPPSFFFGSGGLYQERNVRIEGGEAQRQYADYRAAILPFEIAAKNAHYALYIDPAEKKRTAEETKPYEQAYKKAEADLANARRAFMNAYPTYHISARLWGDVIDEPFTFTDAELDALWGRIKGNDSSVRVARLEKTLAKARTCVKGKKYSDFTALDPEGGENAMSAYAGKGKWVLLDFWASWCGPCRMSIPAVREIYKSHPDRLEVISVSCDAEDASWRKAMAEEKMEWRQFRMPEETFKSVSKAYSFNSIPFMLLIDPEGNISFAGHDPAAIASRLN
ncbi:TlpA disulfide reductase family protein [uncultured Duncaniella sp.]|uniref:TlpA disulfide reductase family protein n=1 Tax=uncultured Duncaniella sp. TaxID=2768039 RepID=UPI0025DBA8C0|nr:TlpA disulfide reductase family protein [uncultured Duncaniella sp.]